MKNVTITLPDDTVARLRVASAKEGKSMSKFLAELVEKRLGRTMTQKEALEAFLAGPLLPFSDDNGKIPSRPELYDDHILSRYERDPLQPGSEREPKTRTGAAMAEDADRDTTAGDQSSGHQRVLPRRAS